MYKLLKGNSFLLFQSKSVCKKHIAFTLAEVLISLLIIGIIASIVIPSVLSDIQDSELKVAWKKTYSVLNQAAKMALIDNGGSLKNLCNDNDNECFKNLFIGHLSYIKSCYSGNTYGNCWNSNNFSYIDGTPVQDDMFDDSGLVLSNGTSLDFFNLSRNCTDSRYTILTCGEIVADVNGYKGPNKWGKDVFGVHVLGTVLKPWGTDEDMFRDLCIGSTGINSGRGCAAKYLK